MNCIVCGEKIDKPYPQNCYEDTCTKCEGKDVITDEMVAEMSKYLDEQNKLKDK